MRNSPHFVVVSEFLNLQVRRLVAPPFSRSLPGRRAFDFELTSCRRVPTSHWFGRNGRLFSLNPHVAEFVEVVIETGDWQIFSWGCGGDQAVHKMGLCFFEAVESV